MKKEKGITLIALVVTIVVLMIIASISIGALTGDNNIIKSAGEAKTGAEINSEREAVNVCVVQVMNKYRKVTKERLQEELDSYAGKGETTVSDAGEVLLVKFERSGRYYEVNKDGDTKYIGTIKDLANAITITAYKEKNLTPEFVQQVELTVTTYLPIENMTIRYAWSTSKTTEPAESEFITASSVTVSEDKLKRNTTAVSNTTGAGNYYLWVKAIADDEVVGKTFGEYAIREDTTLVACSTEYYSTSPFLGNSKLQRNLIKSVKFQTTLDGHTLDESNCWDVSANQKGSILAWYTEEDIDGTTAYNVTIGSTAKIKANPNSTYLFNYIGYGVNTETKIDGLNKLDTSKVTSMYKMFRVCVNLTNLDVSEFDTSNVTNMYGMFEACSNLTNIDVINFNTSKVTNMSCMFDRCESLTNLDLSNFDTRNVTNMYGMFYSCENLTNLDVSNFDTSKVTNMSSMFYSCESLTNLDVSNFNTSQVTNMQWTFNNCKNLTQTDVSNFDTRKVTNMYGMFNYCENLTQIDVSNFNTENVTNMRDMFSQCKNLTKIDVSNFDTSNVTNMSSMFYSCESLTHLDVSNFDTSNVTDMSWIFYCCSKVNELNVSNFNTSKVTNMKNMFYGCSKLASLNIKNFDTSNVTDIGAMFFGCLNLTQIDVSNFNTSQVTNMQWTFNNCKNITQIDVSNFDTSNVTNMYGMFDGCSKLTSLNIENFDTSNVTDMGYMFYGCSKLTSLNIKNFDTSNATQTGAMFNLIPSDAKIYVSTDAMKEWVLARRSDLTNIVVEP